MGNTKIIMKKSGIISEIENIKLFNNKDFLTAKENIIPNIISQQNLKNVKKDQFKEIRRNINIILNAALQADCNSINELYLLLSNANTRDDYIKVIELACNKYYNINLNSKSYNKQVKLNTTMKTIEKIGNEISINSDIVLSVFIKRVLSLYHGNVLNNISHKKLEELYNLSLTDIPTAEIMRCIGYDIDSLSSNTTFLELSSIIFLNTLYLTKDLNDIHLCWQNCVNATCDNCPKIRDIKKKNIEKYDFITDGYQIYDKKGELQIFTVTNCKKYIKSKRK